MNEINTKWTHRNYEKLRRKLRKKGREMSTVTNDRGDWNLAKNYHLPGGVVSIVRGKASSLIEIEDTIKGKCSNWIAIKLKNNYKTLMIINVYRIPATSSGKVCCFLTQCNLIDSKAKLPS